MTPKQKFTAAIAKHLDIPEDDVEFSTLSATNIMDDNVFGPRVLAVVQVGPRTHVLRVMTSPLQNAFSVHEEAVL